MGWGSTFHSRDVATLNIIFFFTSSSQVFMISIQFLVPRVMLSSASLRIQRSYKNGWNFISKVSNQRKKSFFFSNKNKTFFLGLIHLASNRQESGHRNSLSGLRLEVECWFPPKWENSLLPTKFTSPKIPKGNYSLYSQEFQLSTYDLGTKHSGSLSFSSVRFLQGVGVVWLSTITSQ